MTKSSDKNGVPQYMGMSGDRLIFAITLTSTMGFALFGYDQGIVSIHPLLDSLY